MRQAGIAAGAVYFPACAIAGRKALRRVCSADEDAVTLAVEAGDRALSAWGRGAGSIDVLVVTLRHASAAKGPHAQIVREALGLGEDVRVVALDAADALSGLTALESAMDAVAVDRGDTVALVIAAEAAGGATIQAAAGALIITIDEDDSAPLVAFRAVSRVSGLTHERWAGSEAPGGREPDFRFIEHRYHKLSETLVDQHSRTSTQFDELYFAGGSVREHAYLHRAVRGTELAADRPVSPASDAGVAGPLVAVVEAVSRNAGDRHVALVASGSGQVVQVDLAIPGYICAHFAWTNHGELRAPVGPSGEGPELSLPLESPFYARDWAPMLRLEAAKCESCGYVAFPPSQRPICPECHSRQWQPHLLSRRGTVFSHLENRFLPAGFPASLVFVLGELSDGFRYWAPMPPEVRGAEISIGDPLRLALRRFTERDGLAVYGMKFVIAADASADEPVLVAK